VRGVQHFIGSYGYLAIFLLMIAESACIPVPSELTMPLGGALAAGAVAGVHLSLVPVIAVGVAGNLVGSYIAWAVGLYGGRSVIRRSPRILGGHRGLERAQRWFDRYGGRAVFFGRLLPAVRTFISLPAGFARMSALRFGIYTVAGCVPWITGLAWAGYAAGANWKHVDSALRGASYVVAGVVALLVAGAIIVAVRARRRRQQEEGGGGRQYSNGDAYGSAQNATRQQTGADHGSAGELPLPREQRRAG
jgi:membrane protein DedA with SNARE-associated domain